MHICLVNYSRLWCWVWLNLFSFFSILIFDSMIYMGLKWHHSPLEGNNGLCVKGLAKPFPKCRISPLEARGTSMKYGLHVSIQFFTLGGNKGRIFVRDGIYIVILVKAFWFLYLASPRGLGTPSPFFLGCIGNLLLCSKWEFNGVLMLLMHCELCLYVTCLILVLQARWLVS